MSSKAESIKRMPKGNKLLISDIKEGKYLYYKEFVMKEVRKDSSEESKGKIN